MIAIEQLRERLRALQDQADTEERAEEELELLTALGPGLIAAQGYASPEVEATWKRARALSKEVGNTPRLFQALRGIWSYRTVRSDHARAGRVADHLVRLGEALEDPTVIAVGYQALGTTAFYQGRFGGAADLLERSLDAVERVDRDDFVARFGQDPRATTLAYLGWTQWFLGHTDDAFVTMDRALAAARELGHEFSVAFCLTFSATLRAQDRDVVAARACVDECIALSTREGFPLWLGITSIIRGWTLAADGSLSAGAAAIREGLQRLLATGARLGSGWYQTLWADACLRAGDTAAGHDVVDAGLAFCVESGERWCEWDLLRQRGDLHRLDGELEEAEAAHARAATLAATQGRPE